MVSLTKKEVSWLNDVLYPPGFFYSEGGSTSVQEGCKVPCPKYKVGSFRQRSRKGGTDVGRRKGGSSLVL